MATLEKNRSLLSPEQLEAVNELRTGSILWGGVGSGKSRTALAYTETVKSKQVYVITTAKKRDSKDWIREASLFGNSTLIVDSWNNISKYQYVEDSFFIFDEQRVVGYGSWVKSFLKIAKKNDWILLSATPGDTWLDYIPVFIANGFYKNKTDFYRKHVVFNTFSNYPKVDHFVEERILQKRRNSLLVKLERTKVNPHEDISILCDYDKVMYDVVTTARWNPFKNEPIRTASEYCYTLRKVVNSHPSRIAHIMSLQKIHKRLIVFYSFDYELELLRTLNELLPDVVVSEHNGHIHEEVPNTQEWIYLVQYISGSESWECITTNAVALYSLSYSWKLTEQSFGRVDRMNTPYGKLYFYKLYSDSVIDRAIIRTQEKKEEFNEYRFANESEL